MGILIPPSINAIIGITTTLVHLFSCHSPKWQCSISTLLGILYHFLNFSLCSSVSTKLKKSTHLIEKKEISRRHPKSIKKKNHEDTYKKIEEKGLLRQVIRMGDWVFFFSPLLKVKMGAITLFPPLYRGQKGSGNFPTPFNGKMETVGSWSHRRTWGTGNCL